ncbi:hypothetical protein E4U25_008394 [Claviceps purpurea]|nr:hypothetical protein E4U25_008394 [Claviceps purpurea]
MEALYRQTFSSLEAIKAAINSTCEDLGFSVVTHQSLPNATNPSRIQLRCCKGRRYRSQQGTAGRLRPNTSSQMTGCLFKLEIRVDRGVYALNRVKSSQICDHNHELDAAPLLQVRNKRLQQSEEKIPSLWNSGIPPLQMLKNLRYDDAQAAEAIGLQRLEAGDSYEPGTVQPRAYMRAVNRIEDIEDDAGEGAEGGPPASPGPATCDEAGNEAPSWPDEEMCSQDASGWIYATQIPPDYEGDIDEYITKGLEEQRALLEASQDINHLFCLYGIDHLFYMQI